MQPLIRKSRSVATPVAIASLLAGCVVGPNYKGPPAAAPLSAAAGQFRRADTGTVSAPPPARWWEALNDPVLTGLIDQALEESPTIHEAQARLRAARSGLDENRAKRLPNGGANALEATARVPTGALNVLSGGAGSGGASISDINLYSAGFDASWELDIFGGTHRAIEAAGAQAGAQEAQLEDAQVELAAEVAQAYVGLRDVQTRLRWAKEALELERRTFDLVSQRRSRGVAADGDVERAQAGFDQADAQIAPLEGQAEQFIDQITILTGREPGWLDAVLAKTAPVPVPPTVTPVGDPASLLRRRPDVRAAERRLAARNAQIGQNVAQLFPSVRLLGDIGFVATDPGQLLSANKFSAIGAPSLSWRILNYPRIQAQIHGAEANRDAEAAQYEATVLSALQDAEGSLSRFGHQRQSVVALSRAEAASGHLADLTRRRYQAGTASLIDVLDAQRQQNQARQALAQDQAQLTTDYVALQKSLGLGWGTASINSPLVRHGCVDRRC